MAGQASQWTSQGTSFVDGLWSILARTGFVLPTLILLIAYLAIRYPDRVPGTASMKGRELMYSPPGALPIFGHTLSAGKILATDPLQAFLDLSRRSQINCFTLTVLGVGRLTWLNQPEYVQHMQAVNFNNYVKPSYVQSALEILLGARSIFLSNGEQWHHQRKKAVQVLNHRHFRDWSTAVITRELDTLVALLDRIAADGEDGKGTVKFTELLPRFSLSSFAKMAFSTDVECLSSDPASIKSPMPFALAFEDVQIRLMERFGVPGWQITELWSENGRRLREDVRILRQVGKDIIAQRVRQNAAKAAGGNAEAYPMAEVGSSFESIEKHDGVKDIVDFSLESADSEEDVLTIAMSFLFAGVDTTAQGLGWVFYELVAAPEWAERVREELAAAGLATTTDGSYRLESSDISKLPVTHAVWSESLRLHLPSTAQNFTALKDEVIIPQGPNPRKLPPIPVKAGETVGWSYWVIARTPSVWGDDCEKFNPLRFLSKDEATGKFSYIQHSQYLNHSFNAGPRLCPGMNLANFDVMAFIAAVLPRYDFGWATEEQGQTSSWPPVHATSLTHPIKDGYVLTVKRRGA